MSTNENNSTKGSVTNPYTEEEMNSMMDEGTWTGGYVVGMGYVGDDTTIWGSSGSEASDSEESSDSWDEYENQPNNPNNSGGGGGGNHTNSSPNNNAITLTGKSDGISTLSYNLLKSLPNYYGEIHITSVARSPEEQAQAMLTNIKKNGVQSQLDLYAAAGDQVIYVYDSSLSDSVNLQNMIAKIIEIGPSNVSKHCADPTKLNVFDVSRSRLSNPETFMNALDSLGIDYIDEPQNGCIHIEIPQ